MWACEKRHTKVVQIFVNNEEGKKSINEINGEKRRKVKEEPLYLL